MTTHELKAIAKKLGINIVTAQGGGWWLTKTDGSDLWEDDNFCSSRSEIETKLDQYKADISWS